MKTTTSRGSINSPSRHCEPEGRGNPVIMNSITSGSHGRFHRPLDDGKAFSSISIYGGGGWGTALACQIARNYETVPLFLRNKQIAEQHRTSIG